MEVVSARPPRAETAARSTAWWPIALVALAGIGLAAGLAVVDGLPVGVVADDALYVILARALQTGQGFRFLNIPGHPFGTHFPPGYPALLALLSVVVPAFPASVVAFKAMNALFLAAASVLVAWQLRTRLQTGAWWAFALGLTTAVSVPLLTLGSMVLSELFFLALVLALLPALERAVDAPCSRVQALLLGAGIAACTLVRSHGVVLLPALVLCLFARRRWRDAALVSAATIVCLLPWQLWMARHGGTLVAPLRGMYDSYTAWWIGGVREMGPSMITATLAKTIPETTGMLAVLFSPVRGSAAHAITLVALGSLAVAGCVSAWRRIPVTLLFVAGYLTIVFVWPFQTARFVWAIWPLLLLIVVLGGRAAIARPTWRVPVRAALAAGFVWVAVGYGLYEQRAVHGAWWSSIARMNTASIVPAVRWIAGHTAPGELVASDNEGAVYLYTGRQALPVVGLTPGQYLRDYSAVENAVGSLRPILDAYPVRTVVVGSGKSFEMAQFLVTTTPHRLALRELFDGGAAFTVLPR